MLSLSEIERSQRMVSFKESRILETILEVSMDCMFSPSKQESNEASIDFSLAEIGQSVNLSWRNVPKHISPHTFGLYVNWNGRHESGCYAKLGTNYYSVVDSDTLLHIAMRIDYLDGLLRCLSRCKELDRDKENSLGETAASINPEKFARFFSPKTDGTISTSFMDDSFPINMNSALKSAVCSLRSERNMSIAERKQSIERGRVIDEAKPALRAAMEKREQEDTRRREESRRAVWYMNGREVHSYTRDRIEEAYQSGTACFCIQGTDTSGFFQYDLKNMTAIFTDDMGYLGENQVLSRSLRS